MADIKNKKLISVEGLARVTESIKTYVDTKQEAMETRVQAVEGKKHEHTNQEVLDGITAEKVTAWDGKAEVSAVEAAQATADQAAADIKALQEGAVKQNTNGIAAATERITALEGLVVGGEGEGITAILSDVANLKVAVGTEEAGLIADMNAVEGRLDGVEGRLDALDGVEGRMAVAEGSIDALKGRMDTAEGVIETANGRLDALDSEEGRMAVAEGAIDALEERVAANESALEVLKGEGEGSIKQAVASGIAEVVAGADEDFNTLKEIADWILADGTNAAGLQTQVAANKTALEVLNGSGVGSVTKAVADEAALRDAADKMLEGKVSAEETRAKGEESRIEGLVNTEVAAREALNGRVAKLEGIQHHDHENKAVLDGITAEKVAAWDGKAEVSAVEAAQTQADKGVADAAAASAAVEAEAGARQQADEALSGRIEAVEGRVDEIHTHDNKELLDTYTQKEEDLADAVAKKHEHANADVLNGITAEQLAGYAAKAEVSAVEAAQSAAEKHADNAIAALRTAVISTFNNLNLEMVDLEDGQPGIQIVLDIQDGLGTSPLSSQVAIPVADQDDMDQLLVELGLKGE